ncbi:hypothetical protein KNJ79_05035 [Sphingopyxis indica]|uniref:DUF6557 family protein n=1 Tax=Sphingopyxis indica TaxID=436663 RepID=UPI0029394ACB|nr:DUF6557 family protein [Sphingopyxis indica]WOF44296.1 hypothetical protein KNJ79_05035 [Sphingopyxis indica]
MNVSQIINASDPHRVAEIYCSHYGPDDGWGNVESVLKFRTTLNNSIGVDEGDGMVVLISSRKDDGDERIDVSGRDAEATNWAIEFEPWGRWKLLPVVCEGVTLNLDEIATHLYYEMTYAGWPEQALERYNQIVDAADAVQRDFS